MFILMKGHVTKYKIFPSLNPYFSHYLTANLFIYDLPKLNHDLILFLPAGV